MSEANAQAATASAMSKADEANSKIKVRQAELAGYAGKTFRRKDGLYPNLTFTIIRYSGIVVPPNGGNPYHSFWVETKNPGGFLTLPATQFLTDHEEIQVSIPEVKEVI